MDGMFLRYNYFHTVCRSVVGLLQRSEFSCIVKRLAPPVGVLWRLLAFSSSSISGPMTRATNLFADIFSDWQRNIYIVSTRLLSSSLG